MQQAINIIKQIAGQTDKVILFHSASGKDSIALLDLLHPYFNKIVCVYMYVVKDLEHINRYISYAQNKYPKARFIQVPHYAVYSYIKTGFMGCAKNPKQKKYSYYWSVKPTHHVVWVGCKRHANAFKFKQI